MENKSLSVGLDIGTTKIVAIIGMKNDYGKFEILGFGKAHSLGVQRGVVVNITQTIDSIKYAIKKAEEDSGYKINKCVVGIAGQHIRSLQHSDYIIRNDDTAVIDQNDIEKLIDNVHKLVMKNGEEIIHVLPQHFSVDSEPNIKLPIGMLGRRLEANLHVVIGQTTAIGNICTCIQNSGLKVSGITLEPLASASAVLSEEEKEAGVCLIDIGGGTTDLAIFKDGVIRHTSVIPFGGNIITKDIQQGCSIIEKHAEQLKVKFGSALPLKNSDRQVVSIPGFRGREPKEISLKTLAEIINSRLIEIIDQILIEIKNYGYEESKNTLICGIVLTGGGSNLKHIKQLFVHETGLDTRLGFPNEHLASGERKDLDSPMYSTAIGLLMNNYKNDIEKNSNSNLKINSKTNYQDSFFDKWVKKFMEFLNNEN